MYKKAMLGLFCFLAFTGVSQDSVYLTINSQKISIFEDEQISSDFVDNGNKFHCGIDPLYSYEQTNAQYLSNQPYGLTVAGNNNL